MRAQMKINAKTGVIYLPKVLIKDGFKGAVDLFGYGPVLVIIRPNTDPEMIIDCLTSVSKDIKMSPSMKSYSGKTDGKLERR